MRKREGEEREREYLKECEEIKNMGRIKRDCVRVSRMKEVSASV